MNELISIQDFIISFLSMFDVLSGAILALSYGYLMLPSALGYLVGAIGSMITGAVTPVSFMYESLVLSGGLSKIFRERISMIVLAALITGILGIFGIIQLIVNSIGKEIFFGMLAGVGLYLAQVGIDIARKEAVIGIPSFVVAIIVQLTTNDLALTVALSVSFGVILNYFINKSNKVKVTNTKAFVRYKSWREMLRTELRLVSLVVNRRVLIGTLALSTLTIGGNIAYTAANSQIASSTPTFNQSTVISSIADFASSLFGGANMELIISPTAGAPHPTVSAVIFMLAAAGLMASGVVYSLAKKIPISVMGGYLFVIGAILILPYNAIDAFKSGSEIVVGITMAITVFTNPFYGILAGSFTKFIIGG